METLAEFISTFGFVGLAFLIVADKVGILDRFLPKKNGNGNGHIDVKKIAVDAAELVATNHFHEVPVLLREIRDLTKKHDENERRIEEGQARNFNNLYEKLDKLNDSATYLVARSNGRS